MLFVVFLLFSFPCCFVVVVAAAAVAAAAASVLFLSLFLVDWLLLLLFVGVFVERINVGLLLEIKIMHPTVIVYLVPTSSHFFA